MKLKAQYLLGIILLLSSCASLKPRDIVYFSNLPQEQLLTEQVADMGEPVIKTGDLLTITVMSLDQKSNMLFNQGVIMTGEGSSMQRQSSGDTNEGYLVDKEGFIEFPVLGKIKLAGLTKEQAMQQIKADLNTYVENPIVKVRQANFRFTVLGEVNGPSVITVPTDKESVTILEAMGMVGDMTIYGKRENVLVIRHVDGVRTMARLNLNNREVFSSPYFYLKQNDVVYVEPDKAKIAGTSLIRRNWGFAVGLVSTAFFVYSLFK
ncbi:polysaccharide biosynthesis/export family protein [Pontibacter sp. MBLB2868]|uniref:polysaccharide biosynthesis/export family protein n=1 Tax=Pontibacter sp. MBLB2868 TaxID=3451555 RepID=UPI003F74C828